MANILRFDEAIKKANDYGEKHLLLGNGFSIAYRPDIFTYDSLFKESQETMSTGLAKIFEEMKTKDFEEIIRTLQSAAMVVSAYDRGLEKIINKIREDAEKLKAALIHAITERHPKQPNDIPDENYSACRTFLSNFVEEGRDGKIYTMNYDLLLYWTLMRKDAVGAVKLHFNDGFGKGQNSSSSLEWQGESAMQNIHYLHGALHLSDIGHKLQKFTSKYTGERLVDQVKRGLKNDIFPLFVAEGTSEKKLTKIQHSAYLRHSLKSFTDICRQTQENASLFVFGHSFSNNDAHVLDQIGRGKIRHVFVSLYSGSDGKPNMDALESINRISALRKNNLPLEIEIFDAASAKVWGDISENKM